MERLQKKIIINDLNKKIVFLLGPRQVGKTYLAKEIAKEFKNPLYLNFDNPQDKKIIAEQSWLSDIDLIIFDEIHKMENWKNYLKGIYDTKPSSLKILVTGSARLDVLKYSGDSLAGRYFCHRLLPFTLSEISKHNELTKISRFLERGGFPEPFLCSDKIDSDRWRIQYLNSMIRFDILDFENVHDLKSIQTLLELLRTKVGSPISYTNIAGDLSISPNTVRKYIEIFEALYIIFRIVPYAKNIARSLLKEPKIYFFDTGLVKGDEGIKFENMAALSLLKYCYLLQDTKGIETELKYLKTKDGIETDFCLSKDNKVEYILETKNTNDDISKGLKYFSEKYNFKAIQLVHHLRNERKNNLIEIRDGLKFLKALNT